MLSSGYVLSVASVQRLHQLNAKAGIVSKEQRELVHQQVSGSPKR